MLRGNFFFRHNYDAATVSVSQLKKTGYRVGVEYKKMKTKNRITSFKFFPYVGKNTTFSQRCFLIHFKEFITVIMIILRNFHFTMFL